MFKSNRTVAEALLMVARDSLTAGQLLTKARNMLQLRVLTRCFIGLLLVLMPLLARADVPVSGSITANTTWTVGNGRYVLSGDVTIDNQAILTVQAGVQIRLAPGANLIVQRGALRAAGTRELPIVMTSTKEDGAGGPAAPGDWGKLIFRDGTDDANTALQWLQIRYGHGVKIESASPSLHNVAIDQHAGAAIEIDLASSPSGSGLSASGNTLNGILTPAGDVTGTVQWGLLGIPYIVSSGEVSVGTRPLITALSPNMIEQGSSVSVSVSGSRLGGLSNVHFDNAGLSAVVQPGGNASQATLSVSAISGAPRGASAMSVLTDAGEILVSNAITVQRREPKLLALSPTTIYAKQAPLTLTISGADLLENTVAELDGVALTTQYISATQLQAVLPTQATVATRSLRLRTPDPENAGGSMFSSILPIPITNPPVVTLKGSTEYGPPANGVTEFSIAQPSTTAVGDYLVLLVYRRRSVTVPDGFALLAELPNSDETQWVSVYGKTADTAGVVAHRITQNGATARVGASILDLRASGVKPVLYGPWKKIVNGTSVPAHTVPSATSPVDGLAVAVNHELYAAADGGPNAFYANSPYVSARTQVAPNNRFAVATRSVVTGTALGGSVTASYNLNGGDMVLVFGW